jgi:transposase
MFVVMAKEPIISNERVDALPVLLTQIEQMGVQKLLDKHFPRHGNWQGQSLGQVAVIWLTHILSQADHRLNHVQAWGDKRLETLKIFFGDSLRSLDLTDDRLEAVLRYFNCDRNWYSFEKELGSSLLRVYDIEPEQVRLDSTTASSHCGVNPEGLFQWGHSKDHRPDLAQVKIMLSTLDPLGRPIATEILSGEKADDPLYIPAIERVGSTLQKSGLLYIGDCKMASIATRNQIDKSGDFYLCPYLKQAVGAYRDEYLTERGLARLKGFPLSLTPIYLQREDHVTGLIRLLSIGLRVLTLLEFQVRRNLNQNSEELAGLYVGNPKRKTARPTAEIILAAFKEITLLLIEVKNEVYAHVTALSPLQERILVLLGFSTTIYTQLGGQSFTPE